MSCQPPHGSALLFPNVVFARSLPEMFAARHYVVEIACGCAAHTVLAVPVAPQMFRCRGGSLSRAHLVCRPPCTPRQRVTTRESFFWVDVIFRKDTIGYLCPETYAVPRSDLCAGELSDNKALATCGTSESTLTWRRHCYAPYCHHKTSLSIARSATHLPF